MNPRSALRRGWLASLALALGAGLSGCAGTPAASRAERIEAVQVAPGVYAVQGSAGLAEPANLGRVGNSGFIVGPNGVIAVDMGTSFAHGELLLAAIRRVTDKPVRLALVTHTRPEFLFGGAAFRARGIPVAMQERTARLMASRCETCLKQLRATLGDAALAGTTMYKADRELPGAGVLNEAGRPVRVLYFGYSSGPGDIAVLDEQTGVLFGGGLLDAQRVPDIQDSDLPGWHAALRELGGMRVSTVVPGHGPITSSAVIGAVGRYLDRLEARARALAEAGTSLIDVPDATELPEFAGWAQYDTVHRRNASVAYLRFERELFFKQ